LFAQFREGQFARNPFLPSLAQFVRFEHERLGGSDLSVVATLGSLGTPHALFGWVAVNQAYPVFLFLQEEAPRSSWLRRPERCNTELVIRTGQQIPPP